VQRVLRGLCMNATTCILNYGKPCFGQVMTVLSHVLSHESVCSMWCGGPIHRLMGALRANS